MNTSHTERLSEQDRRESLEALEREWEEAQRVIYSDDYSDAAYWTAVERSRELKKLMDSLSDDPESLQK